MTAPNNAETGHGSVPVDDAVPCGGVPVTVVTGFTGAGKTTLVNAILAARPDERLAVVTTDAAGLTGDDERVRRIDGNPAELVAALAGLGDADGPDGVIFEATGFSEPLPIAAALEDERLAGHVHLANLVTVVDGDRFWADYERMVEVDDGEGNRVSMPLAPLLVEQVEGVNVILLNRTDLAGDAALDELEGYLRNLNPAAELRRTVRADVDVAWLLGTERYGVVHGEDAADHDQSGEPESDVDAFGFNSFVYTADRPFIWDAFAATLEEWPDAVMRSKGFAVFADHPPVLLSMIRDTVELTILDADASDDHKHDHEGHHHDHEGHDHGSAGDEAVEATEIVYIGRGMPTEEIVARLDACLATEA